MTAIIFAACIVALAPPPADACSKRHQSIFERFDEAATVAVVKVTWVSPSPNPKNRLPAGPVELSVARTLKGARSAKLVTRQGNTSCHVGFRAGRRGLVFVAANGDPVGVYEAFIAESPRDRDDTYARTVRALDAWAAAADPAARLAVLIALIGGDDPTLAHDAAWHLADEPELLAALDATQRRQLDAAATTAPKHARPSIERVLARVHAASRFETERDPAALADAIDRGTGEHDPDRIAAFERCERVRGRRLDRFTEYGRGVAAHFWARLADACRTGTRAR